MKQRKIITAFLALNLCIAVLLTGCNKSNGIQPAANGKAPSEVLVMTVGEEEVYLDEVNYYALSFIASMNIQEGTDVSQPFSGTYSTMDEALKAQLLTQIRQSKILYLKAVEAGVTLTSEDETEVNSMVDTYLSNSDEKEIEDFGINRELLSNVFTQYIMIRKLENKIAAGVETETETETYGTTENLIFLKIELNQDGNAAIDKDGNYIYLSEEEQAHQRELAEEALERIQNGEDVLDLVKEYGLEATSGTMRGTTDSLRKVYGLQDGEISDLIENDYSYTIVKMVALVDEDYMELVNAYNSETAGQAAVEEVENLWFDAFPISDEELVSDVWEAFTFQDFL